MRSRANPISVIKVMLLVVFLFMQTSFAFAKVDPYSYKNRYLMPIYEKTFLSPSKVARNVSAVKKGLPSVAPQPLVTKDADGNVTIASANSKFTTRIDRKGNIDSILANQVCIKRDYDGNITETKEFEGGTGKATVKNEFGEVTGFEEYGLGGKILKSYDEEHNLTTSFGYSKRTLAWVVDELTHTRTICDRYGKSMYDIDFEGNRVAFYEYNGKDLKWKVDIYGNKTIYEDQGKRSVVTLDFEGNVIASFNYNDSRNRYRLTSITDQYGNVTEYIKGRPQKMKDAQGNTMKEWSWQGTKLVMTKDIVTNGLFGLEANKVSWYRNGKPTHTTIGGVTTKNWVRIKGKTVGVWDQRNKELTLLENGRVIKKVNLEQASSISEVKAWIKANWAV